MQRLVLSSAQQRLWFLDQLTPGSSAYNLFSSQHIAFDLDAAVLERCLTELVRRHEILRTNFRSEGGQPIQVIAPAARWSLPVLDLTTLPESARPRTIEQVVAEETARPFDLTQDRLLRTLLIRAAPNDNLFIMVMHHIVADAMSIVHMRRELAALYTAYVAGAESPLPELPIQYVDYAAWQQAQLESESLGRQLTYWREKLGGDLPALALPLDVSTRAAQVQESLPHIATAAGSELAARQEEGAENGAPGVSGGWQSRLLSPQLSTQLVVLAQSEQATIFMVMLAAFKLLLGRLAGQDDIIVGTPVLGRNHQDVEKLVGLFLNTLVLRTDLSGDPTFYTLLRRVQETTLEAYSNQDLPFERLVEELQPQRQLHRNPLFDVLVNFFSQADETLDTSAQGYDLRNASEQESKLPLTFYIDQYRDQIGLRVLYQQALFSPARMQCLLDQYEFLLEQIATDPFQPISRYSLVTPASRALLPDPTAAIAAPPQEPAMQAILRWAQTQPSLPAIVQGEIQWTYGELGAHATALAKDLVARGCSRGDVVAVTGPRSPGLIAAMTAVMLGGGVLLTLDAALPIKRREVMLREAHARWLLHCDVAPPNPLLLAVLDGPATAHVLWIDPNTGQLHHAGTEIDITSPLPEVNADDPAYVFFTSGTTNVPKGVLGVHKGLSHFLAWQRTTFQIGPGDRAAQLTGLSFDVVLRDIFTPLTSGAALYLPSETYIIGSPRIIEWLHDHAITVLHTVPGIAQSWLAAVSADVKLDHLRWVFFAGEPLSQALVQAWRDRFGAAGGIVNLYGPTETTLAKFCYQAPLELLPGVQPVGSPLPQTQALVLRGNALCGLGEPGEIVIRTPFHSLGYINAPDEQRSRFVANPFRNDPNDLIYRTGDCGRYRLDGRLDILGRLDDQIKIHGVRIEVGEITAALLEHPAIKAAAVIAVKDIEQRYTLVAYVVKDPHRDLTSQAVREHLTERFASAMVPGSYVFLDSLPLNANGKVDRKALPAPPAAAKAERGNGITDAGSEVVLPRDETEGILVAIWQELLGADEVGIDDDFFVLGGHSMLAVRMFAAIYDRFGVHLPLTSLFKGATIRHLAVLIAAQKEPAQWTSLVEMKPTGAKPPFYCVHGMTGDVFWFRDLLEHLDPEQPFWGLQSQGLDAVQPPLPTIEAMAAHYVAEIRALQPQGPYYVGGYSYGGSIAYEMACQLREQGQEVALLAIIDHATPASGYYTYKITPYFLLHFLRNLPYRVQDFLRRRPDQIWARIRRQFLIFNKAADRSRHPQQRQLHAAAAGELIDQAPELPDHVQRVIETNFDAILGYHPRLYPGKLTLLRARGGRLFCTHDPTMGWKPYALEGVDVRAIPGSHLRLFHKTHVRHLARQLQQCLDEAQQVSGEES
jgi:amino acid adenylation domain-containing protein